MAQDVRIAGMRNPLSPGQDPAAGLIGQAAGAVRRFREGSLEDRVSQTADTAAELADETRTQLAATAGAVGGGRSPAENQALFETAEGLTAEELLSAREQEVTDQANVTFGRYRRALGQGATNAQAARIAVEKEMNDLISANPAFADTIRTAAARSLGQTEFQVLTRDRPAGGAGSEYRSQFEKDKQSMLDVIDAQAALSPQKWSPEYKQARTRQALSDLATRYELENSNQLFSAGASFDENQSDLKVSNVRKRATLGANRLLTLGLDMIDQSGQSVLGEQQLADIRVNVQGQMQALRMELENTLPPTISQEDRNTKIAEALQPYSQVLSVLEGNRSSVVLQSIRNAQQLGSELTFSELLPFTMGMSDAFGQNYGAVAARYEPGKLADLVFQNNGAPELREMVNNGEISRTEIPKLIAGRIQRNINAALSGDPNVDWRTVGAGYLGPAAASISKSGRDGDEQYGEVLDATAAANPVEVQKQIVGTANLDKHQQNVVNIWSTAVDQISSSAQQRVSGRASDTRDTYVMAGIGSDGRLRFTEYTAILGTDPDTGEDVWRVQGQRPIENLSNAVSRLANRYGVGQGRSRSVLSHPQLNTGRFQGMNEEEYVQSIQDKINSSRDVPEWLTGQRRAGVPRTPNQEDISSGTVSSFFRAVGNAATSLFSSPEQPGGTSTQVSPVEGQRVTVARIKNAVEDFEAGREQTPGNRALATIFATPNAEDLGMTQEQLNQLTDEERYRVIADVINQRLQ